MKKLFTGASLYVTFGVLAVIILVAALVLIGVGRAYKGGLASLLQTQKESAPVKRKQVNRITLKKGGENSCIEITPDGVVRIFKECGGNLSEARRLEDTRNLQLLFQALSLQDESLFTTCDGLCYEVTIETDEGTQTLYIPVGGGGTGTGGSIGDLIEDIEEQVTASPSPTPGAPLPSPTPGVTPLPSPTPGGSSSPLPSGGGTGGESEGSFYCDFSETDPKKPYRVSGVVCTTEPSPVP